MRPQTLAPLIAAALAFGASAAVAAPSDAISIRVKISDLNLQSPAGAQVALRRISTAARLICRDESGVRDLKRQALGEACVRKTVTTRPACAPPARGCWPEGAGAGRAGAGARLRPACLGDYELALELLEPVFAQCAAGLLRHVATDPDLDPIRGDPRFVAMTTAAAARLGLSGDPV
jgi:UrcA family protein